jgi:hypothetical protein
MKKLVRDLTGLELNFFVDKAEGYDSHRRCETWLFMGPIIEREKITLIYQDDLNLWGAEIVILQDQFFFAETSLVAAMRCFVASKFGEYVEIED